MSEPGTSHGTKRTDELRHRSGRDARLCATIPAVKPADAKEAAAILGRVLAAIDQGELNATAEERRVLEGALIALETIALKSNST